MLVHMYKYSENWTLLPFMHADSVYTECIPMTGHMEYPGANTGKAPVSFKNRGFPGRFQSIYIGIDRPDRTVFIVRKFRIVDVPLIVNPGQ